MIFLQAISMTLLSGCGSFNSGDGYDFIQEPALNIVVSASVDEPILSGGILEKHKGIYFATPQKISAYTFSAGVLPEVKDTGKYRYYSFANTGSKNATSDNCSNMHKLSGIESIQYLMVRKSDKRVCVMTYFEERYCNRDVEFEDVEWYEAGEKSFQKILLYKGRLGDIISINYQELKGSAERARYDSLKEYDLSASDEIAYKSALIKVLSADSQKIEYIVLRNFGDVKQ